MREASLPPLWLLTRNFFTGQGAARVEPALAVLASHSAPGHWLESLTHTVTYPPSHSCGHSPICWTMAQLELSQYLQSLVSTILLPRGAHASVLGMLALRSPKLQDPNFKMQSSSSTISRSYLQYPATKRPGSFIPPLEIEICVNQRMSSMSWTLLGVSWM